MGILFILIYITIVLAVIEINVVLFRLTGLEKEIARFQVISMLTGTGFTTGESELIIEHPIRRKLGAFLIMFGAFSLAVIISAISNILSENFYTMEIAYVAGLLIILVFILKIPPLQKKLINKFKSNLKEHYEITELPIGEVLLTNEEDQVLELPIYENSPTAGKKLEEIIDLNEDIIVLFIQRGKIKIRNECLKQTVQAGDVIILYGSKEAIKNRFVKDLQIQKEQKTKEQQLKL